MTAPQQRPIPFAPLIEACGPPPWIESPRGMQRRGHIRHLCERLHSERQMFYRIESDYGGMITVEQAERWADRLDVNPRQIWPNWDVLVYPGDPRCRECGAAFTPTRSTQAFCGHRCYERANREARNAAGRARRAAQRAQREEAHTLPCSCDRHFTKEQR